MNRSNFFQTGRLMKHILKRDRFRIPIWLISLIFFTITVPVAFDELYPSQQERDFLAETMNNPALIAMVGPADLSNYTIGVMTSHQMLLITALIVGLMSILMMIRHTRADEEDGRLELIRSLPVGKLSMLNASLIVVIIVNIVLVILTGVFLFSLGIESIDFEGSLLYGATLGFTGILFATITAVLAQLTETSRGTLGFAIAILLGSYFLRAIGDVSAEVLSWISPLGWVPMTEVYANNQWWPIVLMILLSFVFTILAYYLNTIRDLGAGLLPSKAGKATASNWITNPIGFALRLQKTAIISWAVGMLLFGLSYGSVFGDLESFIEGNDMLKQIFANNSEISLVEQFISILMIVITLFATIPPLLNIFRLYAEEKKGRLENIMSFSLSRTRLMFSYLIISIVNGFVMISLAAFGLWAAGNAVVDDGISFWNIYSAALAYYPAMIVLIGLATFFIGYKPKFNFIIWLYLFYSFIVLYFGEIFQFSEWVGKLSPFGYIPALPVDEFEWLPIIILTIIAIILIIGGLISYNKRDIQN